MFTKKGIGAALLIAAPVLLWGIVKPFVYDSTDSIRARVLIDVAAWVIAPAITIALLRSSFNIQPRDYGLGKPSNTATFLHQSAVATLIFCTFLPLHLLTTALFDAETPIRMNDDLFPNHALSSLYLAATAAFVEETFYRGFLFLVLRTDRGYDLSRGAYVVASSALFGLNHWSQGFGQVGATFLLGIGAAYYYDRSRSVWPLIVGHFVVDSIVFF